MLNHVVPEQLAVVDADEAEGGHARGEEDNSGRLSILVRPFVSRANHPPGTVLAGLEGTRLGVGFTDSARRQPCARSSVR